MSGPWAKAEITLFDRKHFESQKRVFGLAAVTAQLASRCRAFPEYELCAQLFFHPMHTNRRLYLDAEGLASRARASATSAERASACATAESSSSSLNGFGKKSTANVSAHGRRREKSRKGPDYGDG